MEELHQALEGRNSELQSAALKSDFRIERNLIREIQQHLATLKSLRWKETRPHIGRGQAEVARGPVKGRPQHWRQGDARDRTFLDGGRR
jgi:hypothetical protein